MVYMYIWLAWAGLTLLILYVGAMREPEDRDKRARGILPRLFCFHNVECVNDGQQGSAGQHFVCPLEKQNRKIH